MSAISDELCRRYMRIEALESERDALRAEVEALRAKVPVWVPLATTRPPERTTFLISDGQSIGMARNAWGGGFVIAASNDYVPADKATHWMPLYAPADIGKAVCKHCDGSGVDRTDPNAGNCEHC